MRNGDKWEFNIRRRRGFHGGLIVKLFALAHRAIAALSLDPVARQPGLGPLIRLRDTRESASPSGFRRPEANRPRFLHLMKNKRRFSILALVATALVAPVAAAQNSNASILFMRTNYRAVDSSSDTVLYRVQPSGDNVVQLTPTTFHVNYRGQSWSPSGSAIVYEVAPQSTPFESQLSIEDRQGGSAHVITTGPNLHQQASWGSLGIAFVTNMGFQKCLSIVLPNGGAQHDLFCPPTEWSSRRPIVMSTPKWTPSGQSVFIEVGAYGEGLDPQWISRVYRVKVATGAVVKLTEQVFGDPTEGGDSQTLTISPDGKHGVYADQFTDTLPMLQVDFATGAQRALPAGFNPRYSKDGSKIAFLRDDHVFVMRADGSNVRPAIADPGVNAHYNLADWSSDGKHILVNKLANDRWLQIVTLSTGAARNVTKGTAAEGAWFRP